MLADGFGYGDYSYNLASNEPSWMDLISQGLDRAYQAYTIGESTGYPPGSVNIYAPQTGYPQPSPQPYPSPQPQVTPQPSPGGNVTLSNTTLMLIVGGALLFFLGTKKGR